MILGTINRQLLSCNSHCSKNRSEFLFMKEWNSLSEIITMSNYFIPFKRIIGLILNFLILILILIVNFYF